jgi:multidrug resistance efflux pump
MGNDKLPAIPTPLAIRWREFRVQILPVAVFCVTAVACCFLWREVGTGSNLIGLGEGVRSLVASPQLGWLQGLHVQPYQWIEAGQPLATLQPVDPRSQMDFLQSELQLARLRLEPSLADQNAMNYEQVRFDALRLKQEIAVARAGLQWAKNVLKRNAALLEDKLVSQDAYDLSLKDRDMFHAEIEEKTKAQAEIEGRLAQLRPVGEPLAPGTNHPMLELVDRLEGRLLALHTNWAPFTLTAPISGMVCAVSRQAGEFVAEGELLITINAARSDRIVAYLRQPYPIEPELGRGVEVATRTRYRQKFVSEIIQIGAQVESITNALAYLRQGALVDVGLPIVVGVPAEVTIRPGELVDIAFLPAASKREPETTGLRSITSLRSPTP